MCKPGSAQAPPPTQPAWDTQGRPTKSVSQPGHRQERAPARHRSRDLRHLCKFCVCLGTTSPSPSLHAARKGNKVADALARRLQNEGDLGAGKKALFINYRLEIAHTANFVVHSPWGLGKAPWTKHRLLIYLFFFLIFLFIRFSITLLGSCALEYGFHSLHEGFSNSLADSSGCVNPLKKIGVARQLAVCDISHLNMDMLCSGLESSDW